MQISVFDGSQLVEVRACTLMQLPDGRQAAIYRGLAFPLMPSGNSINIAEEAHPPVPAAPIETMKSGNEPNVPYAVVSGVDQAYIFVAGSAMDLERAAADLRQAGVPILRTGRYLGDPVDGLAADWFVRVIPPDDGERLSDRVGRVLGRVQSPQNEPMLRLRLLAAELAQTRERALRSEAEVKKLKAALRSQPLPDTHRAGVTEAAYPEGAGAGQYPPDATAIDDNRADHATATENAQLPYQPTPMPKRVLAEIEDVFVALLPRIRLLRQCIDVVAIEFVDRRSLYRVLAELDRCETTIPSRWKTVQGVDGWIEKSKVGNGQDSQGRIYARLDRADRSWEVLVSHKAEQDRDIAWLRRQ